MLSSLLTAFARSRPHWKPWRRISLSYSWVAHPLHFPENQCTHFPVYFLQFQPDTLVWVVWHRKKMPGHVDKLSDDTTAVICSRTGEWLQSCGEMLEADTDCRKDADGSAEDTLSMLFALGHCHCPLLKRKKRWKEKNIPSPSKSPQSEVFHWNFKNTICNTKQ